jgi:hypothetical protein
MTFSKGKNSVSLEDIISKVTEADILSYYLGVTEIPTIINSPLREDRRPSFGLYSTDGKRIYYTDLSTRDRGGLFDLLGNMWKCSYKEVLIRINKDIPNFNNNTNIRTYTPCTIKSTNIYNKSTDLQCKVRNWRNYDIKYWKLYGINLEWLKYAEVYPISHKIVIKDNNRYVFTADKYAYAYVEHKEGKVTLKIYQPFNTDGYKWSSNIDRSVWSLWTKIPKYGDNLIISSSVKDCLNIMCNLKIPSICLQGEGYLPKPHIMEKLKSRYKNIIVLFDNDFTNPNNPGHNDAKKLSEEYNLKMVEIPAKYEAKDPSDLFKKYGKNRYLEIMNEILKDVLWKSGEV